MLLFTACGRDSSTPVLPKATASLPSQLLPQSTVTPIPSSLPIIITTPTLLPITQTPTVAPTLSLDEREALILELLKTPSGCELPCWWGIVPGQTSWAETQKFMEHLNAKTSIYSTSGNNVVHSGGVDFAKHSIYNRVTFTEQGGMVEGITINSFSNNPSVWKTDWASYSPEQIISKYGQPDRAWLGTASSFVESGGSSMPYTLWLFYDNLGFAVQYDGVVKYEPVYRICPAFGENGQLLDEIDLFLSKPSNHTPLEQFANVRPEKMKYIRSIDEATGLNVEEFYKLFTQGDKPACFETPRDIWP